MKLKSFRGIVLNPFELRLNGYDGYGVTICRLSLSWYGHMSTVSKSFSVFSFNIGKYYDGRGGHEKYLTITAFGFWKKFILSRLIVLDVEEFQEESED